MKKGLLGQDGKPLPSVEELRELIKNAEIEQVSNTAYVNAGDPNALLKEVAKVIKKPKITPSPERVYLMKVAVEEFKSKSGLYVPTVTSVSGERTGKDGKTSKLYRYFIIAIGSKVREYLDDPNLQLGDEVFVHSYEHLEGVDIPYIVDYETFYETADMDVSSCYNLHFGEIAGWKYQPEVRKAFATTGLYTG